MNNSKALFDKVRERIVLRESSDELDALAYLLMESVFNVTRADVVAAKPLPATQPPHDEILESVVTRINAGEPVQYVLGYAYFFGRRFRVTNAVLIPRPETEELVVMVKNAVRMIPRRPLRVLDIGTGSGCISITLALELSGVRAFGVDVSKAALDVARKNAHDLNADVHFESLDILRDQIPQDDLDVIVSNPPYIARSEAMSMRDNVVLHEPHVALFVDDNDPLIFYREIAAKSFAALRPGGGLIAFEINERFGREVQHILALAGYHNPTITKDINGKDRIVSAIR